MDMALWYEQTPSNAKRRALYNAVVRGVSSVVEQVKKKFSPEHQEERETEEKVVKKRKRSAAHAETSDQENMADELVANVAECQSIGGSKSLVYILRSMGVKVGPNAVMFAANADQERETAEKAEEDIEEEHDSDEEDSN